jgi:hypothetical protein
MQPIDQVGYRRRPETWCEFLGARSTAGFTLCFQYKDFSAGFAEGSGSNEAIVAATYDDRIK